MTSVDYLERMALAGLLHDIGKFAQRGIRDRPRLKHTEAGSDFVRKFVPEALRKGLYPVLGHHDAVETMDGMTRVVALADRLSAGERREYPPGARREFAQMRSIFSRVSLGGDTPPPVVYVPLAETQVAEKSRLMPQRAPSDQASLTDAYAALWEDFCRDARQLRDEAQQHNDAGVYLESLYHLLARYTATIPAAPEVLEDAVRDAVRRGLAMARMADTACFRETLPEGALPDDLELSPPPAPVRGADLTPQALPEAWPRASAGPSERWLLKRR